MIRAIGQRFLNLFFPKVCGYCGDPFKQGLSNVLCLPCFELIEPYASPTCEHCGVSLPERAFEDVVEKRCLDCGEESYYLDQVYAFGPYEGPLRSTHHSFKFEGMEHLKSEMIEMLVANVPASFWEGVEGLVPVPMSPEKQREKGYDPARLLANELSRKRAVLVKDLLQKSKPTVSQQLLSREKRLHNQKGSYDALSLGAVKKIVLVDDVFTTGATLEECAKVLKKAGAQWVGAVVWGRTPRHGSDRASH